MMPYQSPRKRKNTNKSDDDVRKQKTVKLFQASAPDSGLGEDDFEELPKPAAWHDDEDEGIEVGLALDLQGRKLPKGGLNDRTSRYSTLLKRKYESVVGTPKWAVLRQQTGGESSDDEILASCGFIKSGKRNLPAGSLEYKKLKDLNGETCTEGAVNCIQFHPTSTVGLVGGSAGIATLFAVDGKTNHKLHSVKFERFPILCARFAHGGDELILGSRRPNFYVFDLIAAKAARVPLPHGLTRAKNFVVSPDSQVLAVAGKWGEIHLLSSKTKERVGLMKQDGEVAALCYSPDGSVLYGHSQTGDVTVFDMNARRIRHRWTDEGCLNGTSLAVSSSNQFIATGSAQGIVNLYGVDDVLQTKTPKPRKTIFNLTTAIADLQFNSTSETLALFSSELDGAVRLFHVGTGSVFGNFPTFGGGKLGEITAAGFSPGGGYLAFGNKKSTVALYRLKHFKSY